MSIRVLCIDDDKRLFEVLSTYLAQNGVGAEHAADGPVGLQMLAVKPYDAVLLDVMMPGMDGLAVLRRLRDKMSIPVIMLTAKGDETDRVVGLELGADDYIAKPFSPRELLARLRAVLRRAHPDLSQERLTGAGLSVEVSSRQVRRGETVVDLTGLEFDLLAALMRRAGRVVPRTSLLSEAGREDVVVSERTVDVHISHLRKKIGDDPKSPRIIKTVRGVGYVFARDDS